MKFLSPVHTLIFLAGLFLVQGNMTWAQKNSPLVKIGTYDSRIVTMAWSRSEVFGQFMKKTSRQNDSATRVHDTARIKELSVIMMSYQHLLHQMVFSNGSIGMVMATIKDKLPEVAKTAGVSVILSKWEVNFSDQAVETVDLTIQIATLFHPGGDFEKMAGEIGKVTPVPMEELGIESEMLDMYCTRFGKK